LSDNDVLFLSIATPYKWFPMPGMEGFAELHAPYVSTHPKIKWIAVGPDETEEWKRASISTQGRLRTVGVQDELDIYYQASDVYVDPFPLGGLTALLEAGLHGLPLVAYTPHPAEVAEGLGPFDPSLRRCLIRHSDHQLYLRTLDYLADNPGYRFELGREVQRAIAEHNAGFAWQQSLEAVYAHALSAAPACFPSPSREVTKHDRHLATLFWQRASVSASLVWAVMEGGSVNDDLVARLEDLGINHTFEVLVVAMDERSEESVLAVLRNDINFALSLRVKMAPMTVSCLSEAYRWAASVASSNVLIVVGPETTMDRESLEGSIVELPCAAIGDKRFYNAAPRTRQLPPQDQKCQANALNTNVWRLWWSTDECGFVPANSAIACADVASRPQWLHWSIPQASPGRLLLQPPCRVENCTVLSASLFANGHVWTLHQEQLITRCQKIMGTELLESGNSFPGLLLTLEDQLWAVEDSPDYLVQIQCHVSEPSLPRPSLQLSMQPLTGREWCSLEQRCMVLSADLGRLLDKLDDLDLALGSR
jgi:hypothetical protein